jgi:hypothetical protein
MDFLGAQQDRCAGSSSFKFLSRAVLAIGDRSSYRNWLFWQIGTFRNREDLVDNKGARPTSGVRSARGGYGDQTRPSRPFLDSVADRPEDCAAQAETVGERQTVKSVFPNSGSQRSRGTQEHFSKRIGLVGTRDRCMLHCNIMHVGDHPLKDVPCTPSEATRLHQELHRHRPPQPDNWRGGVAIELA